MITTVLLDLDDTILSDDLATEAAFMATALQAQASSMKADMLFGRLADIIPYL